MISGRLAVIGSVQAFVRLGGKVTILVRFNLLNQYDLLIGKTLAMDFRDEGIRVLGYARVSRIAYSDSEFVLRLPEGKLYADNVFVAAVRIYRISM